MNIPETLFTGKNAIFLDQVPSTNTYAMDLIAKTNPPEGTCVYTAYQSAGRGQIGRFWHSADGQNLLISYVFYPKTLKATDQFILNIVSGLAVRDMVAQYCQTVKIKWPNDIYVGDKKIAGILVQNVLRGTDIKATVIGIGLNINEVSFPADLPNPTSISQVTTKHHDLEEMRNLLSAKLEYYYMKMKTGNYDWLKKMYKSELYKINEVTQFLLEGDNLMTGMIIGIDEQGKLLIQSENGIVNAYGFRELRYVI
jgi:BirA family biotin operon repressor/biotin-[acetyl-CoA-carboxylase] ligase